MAKYFPLMAPRRRPGMSYRRRISVFLSLHRGAAGLGGGDAAFKARPSCRKRQGTLSLCWAGSPLQGTGLSSVWRLSIFSHGRRQLIARLRSLLMRGPGAVSAAAGRQPCAHVLGHSSHAAAQRTKLAGHPGDLRRAPRRRVGAGDLKACRVRAVLVTGRADRRCTRTRGLGARFTPVTQAGERPAEGAFRASACVTACTDRAALLRSSAGRTRSPRPSPGEFPPLARWPHTARRARDASPHACPTVLGAHRR
jgi:hypothetical protein